MKESIKTEYLCDRCKHNEICINKDMYKEFQKAADNLYIFVPGENSFRERSIKDVSWLKPTKLECVNFLY